MLCNPKIMLNFVNRTRKATFLTPPLDRDRTKVFSFYKFE